MSPYESFMVLAIVHLGAQLNQIRRSLAGRAELDVKGDDLSTDLANLTTLGLQLRDKEPQP